MHKEFLIWASILGALAVALGAFGAHGLKQLVPPETISSFETGVRYQFYHVFALFITAVLYEKYPANWLRYAGYCFLWGILLFSGSLYLLTAFKATAIVGLKGIGLITPAGGLLFIIGWCCILLGLLRAKKG